MVKLAALISTLAVTLVQGTPAGWVKGVNTYRCMNGVGEVGWSNEAAASAQAYVNTLTSLVHSNSYSLLPPAGPAGENLAMGQGTLEEVLASWYSEIKQCQTLPGCETGVDGSKTAVGHFTALVWKGVTQIGCAHNNITKIYICRFRSGDTIGPWTANMPGAYDLSVLGASKSYDACAATSTATLDPFLPNPIMMYPATAGGMENVFNNMTRKESERIVGIILVCLFTCFCLCFCRASMNLEKDKKPLMGTLRNQSPEKDELLNYQSY